MGNWMGLTSDSRLDNLKNSELNVLLGTEPGAPKYSQNQMKSITKAQLISEIEALIAAMEAVKPEPKVAGKRGPKNGVSKNKACAASKQTNLLKAYRAGTKTADDLWAAWYADNVLQEYCPADKFEALINGTWAGSAARGNIVQLTVEIDDDEVENIPTEVTDDNDPELAD